MWQRITAVDIAQAKQRLAARHAEVLARHAHEIQSLDADQAQIDRLAGLVEAFMRKFNATAAAPPVVAARPRKPWGGRPSMQVAGFDRAVLPIDPRLPPSGAVSIDFQRASRARA